MPPGHKPAGKRYARFLAQKYITPGAHNLIRASGNPAAIIRALVAAIETRHDLRKPLAISTDNIRNIVGESVAGHVSSSLPARKNSRNSLVNVPFMQGSHKPLIPKPWKLVSGKVWGGIDRRIYRIPVVISGKNGDVEINMSSMKQEGHELRPRHQLDPLSISVRWAGETNYAIPKGERRIEITREIMRQMREAAPKKA
ncbi:MAG: hypothetical protein AABW99_01125 [archaeon]